MYRQYSSDLAATLYEQIAYWIRSEVRSHLSKEAKLGKHKAKKSLNHLELSDERMKLILKGNGETDDTKVCDSDFISKYFDEKVIAKTVFVLCNEDYDSKESGDNILIIM